MQKNIKFILKKIKINGIEFFGYKLKLFKRK
jgi:hypothetical protein